MPMVQIKKLIYNEQCTNYMGPNDKYWLFNNIYIIIYIFFSKYILGDPGADSGFPRMQ